MSWRKGYKRRRGIYRRKAKKLKRKSFPLSLNLVNWAIVQALAQVSIKELELTRLKDPNKNLEGLAMDRERERKSWEAKCAELQGKNEKLVKQVTGKFPM